MSDTTTTLEVTKQDLDVLIHDLCSVVSDFATDVERRLEDLSLDGTIELHGHMKDAVSALEKALFDVPDETQEGTS